MINILYITICKIYNYVFSTYEYFFLKNKNISNLDEYFLLNIKKEINLELKSNKKIIINENLQKYILNEDDIDYLIKEIFIQNDLKKIISEITGFNYFLGYVIAYKTKKISDQNIQKDLFANKWHKDKPYSANLIKIIIPLQNIGKNSGGIQIKKKDDTIYKMQCNSKTILVFFPNKNFHKAGNPEKDRDQIMIQLVPSKKWSYNKNLINDQLKIEPKFPNFAYLFRKKILF
ncbi:MAG: hypothetical protein CBC84_002375 [Pelagibacteraceae bacterium TMED124]|nr:hypothetical protein [Candidatus Neomarinimicrobiota bacterium]RPG17199.1 MAG: hypothetical protein CBC84_002375 [Pelagibacteraceae bacterium TMED124]|tara:strand:+ start:2692 stop:3387 length:696 start_codon:yes stop_codon:yes gene_type:complete